MLCPGTYRLEPGLSQSVPTRLQGQAPFHSHKALGTPILPSTAAWVTPPQDRQTDKVPWPLSFTPQEREISIPATSAGWGAYGSVPKAGSPLSPDTSGKATRLMQGEKVKVNSVWLSGH